MKSRQQLWQERKRAEGYCMKCGKKREGDLKSFCLAHTVEKREKQRGEGCKARRNRSKTYRIEEEKHGNSRTR